MRQHLGAVDIANEIRMRGTQWRHAFVLVEGDTDARFYRRFTFRSDTGQSGMVPAHGRENLLACLTLLSADPAYRERVVGIADRDFWALGEGDPPELAGLLLTDGRDREIMMLRSPALARLLDSYGSEQKLAKLRASDEHAVEDLLLSAASPVGYLRWLNERERRASSNALTRDGTPLRLDFNKLAFDRWVDRNTLDVDTDKLLRTLASQSGQPLHQDRVTRALEQLRRHAREHAIDAWDICSGHDLMDVLKLALRSVLGSCRSSALEPMVRVLSLGIYKEEEFAGTRLFASMLAWQARRPAVRLLPREQAPLGSEPVAQRGTARRDSR